MLKRCTQFLLESNGNSLATCRLCHLSSNRNPIYLLSRDKRVVYPWWDLVRQSSTFAAAAGNEDESYDLSIRDIASSFKQWFTDRKFQPRNWRNKQLQSDVESICKILSQGDRGAETENALRQLHVNLTEECVVNVLKLQKDVLPGLKFFDWAGKQTGYCHTRAAYYTIFKMLSRAKLTTVMLNWLESFEKQRNIFGLRFYDTLIMGYVLAGKPEVALQIFARMRFQGLDLDRFAYNVFLNGLVEENCFDVVDIIYKQISRGGFENPSTSCIMMKNLCKQDKLDEAKQLFDEFRRNGGTVNEAVLDILINALCKRKRINEACQLIEEFRGEGQMPMSKVYDTLINALVEEKRVDDALEYFQKRTSEGFVPGNRCYNALVSGLLRKNRLEEVYDLLIEMREKHIFPDMSTINATVCFFCKGGLVDVAIDLFKERSEFGFYPDYVTYNQLINALCKDGKLDEAYSVLKDGLTTRFFPGKKTYFILADALCKAGKLDKMCELIDAGIERQHVPSNSTCTKFISALCKAGRVEDGYLVPSKLRRTNMVLNINTYCALIYGFCEAKRGDMASKLLLEMQEDGHSPSRHIFRAVINVLCETGHSDQVLQLLDMHVSGRSPDANLYNVFINGLCHVGRPDIATRVFENMLENRCAPNANSHISLLHGYLKCKKVVDALKFFQAVSTAHPPSTRLYNVLVSGLCKAGKAELALMFLEEMTGKGFIPSLGCYEELILVLCREGKFNTALKVFDDMKMKGRRSSSFIYNVLLSHCFKAQEVNQAWILFEDMRKQGSFPNVATFNMFVRGLSNARRLESCLGLVEESMEQSLAANVVTYNILLKGLCKEGRMEAASDLFSRMSKKGCVANMWTYDILVHGFSKVVRVSEAQKLMEEMVEKGFYPSRETYRFFRNLTIRDWS
eukprot:Gb_27824 [translate_table: standard]